MLRKIFTKPVPVQKSKNDFTTSFFQELEAKYSAFTEFIHQSYPDLFDEKTNTNETNYSLYIDDTIVHVFPKTAPPYMCVGHTCRVLGVIEFNDLLLTWADDRTIKLWDSDGSCVHTCIYRTNVSKVCVVGNAIVSLSKFGDCDLWIVGTDCVLGVEREVISIISMGPQRFIVVTGPYLSFLQYSLIDNEIRLEHCSTRGKLLISRSLMLKNGFVAMNLTESIIISHHGQWTLSMHKHLPIDFRRRVFALLCVMLLKKNLPTFICLDVCEKLFDVSFDLLT